VRLLSSFLPTIGEVDGFIFVASQWLRAESMISEEGLDPLRDVDNISVLGSRVGMGEVGVMGDW
jgi:hypothetical protein